jgi:hypothetical protein
MRFLGVAVILAILSALLVSSDVAPVGYAFDPANAGPASRTDTKPGVSRSGPEVQRSVQENRDKRAAFGFLFLLRMLGDGGRR